MVDERNADVPNSDTEDLNELMKARRDKLAGLYEKGIDPFGKRFERTAQASDILGGYDQLEGETVRVAGRIMGLRVHGKASFADLQDLTGQIQLFARVNDMGDELYANFANLDLGDIVGVEGEVFRTRRGEISIRIREWVLLAKSLRPLPEKWHGLQDVDLRYRQRYVDLIVNPEVRETFILRSRIITAMREFLDAEGFIEVETPVLSTVAGGGLARPFVTHHNVLDLDVYLRIATELYLKRLIVGGLEKVYEIGKDFRNEGVSTKHNPEFTMLELYWAYADYMDMMDLTERMVTQVAQEVLGTLQLEFQGHKIDLTPPWPRVSMIEALRERIGMDVRELRDDEAARELARQHGVELPDNATLGMVIDEFVSTLIEPELIQPTFLIDHPVDISPLAKRKEDDPLLTYRFEAFVGGFEIGNAFSELNDPIDQRKRFLQQAGERERGNEEAHVMDEDYIRALEYGMPPTGGLGVGVDRVVMLLTNSDSIRDVILFPLMRPRD